MKIIITDEEKSDVLRFVFAIGVFPAIYLIMIYDSIMVSFFVFVFCWLLASTIILGQDARIKRMKKSSK